MVDVSYKGKDFRAKCPKYFGIRTFVACSNVEVKKAKIDWIEIKIGPVDVIEKIVLHTDANEMISRNFRDIFKTENEAKWELERRKNYVHS